MGRASRERRKSDSTRESPLQLDFAIGEDTLDIPRFARSCSEEAGGTFEEVCRTASWSIWPMNPRRKGMNFSGMCEEMVNRVTKER